MLSTAKHLIELFNEFHLGRMDMRPFDLSPFDLKMANPYHIIVEGNPAIIYASRGGTPDKVLPLLEKFLDKFWQERDISGESHDTPECLVAQIIVRFGFEICEDDFSNLKVGIRYDPTVVYLYLISSDRRLSVWVPSQQYRKEPNLGIAVCQPWEGQNP